MPCNFRMGGKKGTHSFGKKFYMRKEGQGGKVGCVHGELSLQNGQEGLDVFRG